MIVDEQKTVMERCLEHLETILGVPVDPEKLRFNPGKQQVVINDFQLFNEIAQASGLRDLRRGKSSAEYNLHIPNGSSELEEYNLAVALPPHLNQVFLRYYGGNYRFR